MKHLLTKWIRAGIFCTGLLFFFGCRLTAEAGDIESMESQSSDLKNELDNVNQELLDIGNDIADVEEKIDHGRDREDTGAACHCKAQRVAAV